MTQMYPDHLDALSRKRGDFFDVMRNFCRIYRSKVHACSVFLGANFTLLPNGTGRFKVQLHGRMGISGVAMKSGDPFQRGPFGVTDEPARHIRYDDDEFALAERALEIVQRRGSPQFFIVERSGSIRFCSLELNGTQLLKRCWQLVDELFRRYDVIAEEAIERVDDNTMLRVVPLSGEAVDCFAAFVESVNGRNAIERAVRRYGISKREADVLELLVNGLTTGQIAERLCISDATVGDHIKSLFRKTKANKRSELVSRVFVQHQDLALSSDPERRRKGR